MADDTVHMDQELDRLAIRLLGPAHPDDVPAAPPPDVLEQVIRAADRADELARQNRELHFEFDDETGDLVIQARDLDGNVLRVLSAAEALDIITGARSRR